MPTNPGGEKSPGAFGNRFGAEKAKVPTVNELHFNIGEHMES
jgi:hypothetical protein